MAGGGGSRDFGHRCWLGVGILTVVIPSFVVLCNSKYVSSRSLEGDRGVSAYDNRQGICRFVTLSVNSFSCWKTSYKSGARFDTGLWPTLRVIPKVVAYDAYISRGSRHFVIRCSGRRGCD